MKTMIVVALAAFTLNSSYAQGQEELGSITQIQSDVLESVTELETQEMFYLHNIAVLTRLELGVEVPWIAKFNIRPEIELQWSR